MPCLHPVRAMRHPDERSVRAGRAGREVLFVGEGPGQSEDEQGLPFVGRSGQLLDKYLFAIDLDRSKNCYIANIVQMPPAPEP